MTIPPFGHTPAAAPHAATHNDTAAQVVDNTVATVISRVIFQEVVAKLQKAMLEDPTKPFSS